MKYYSEITKKTYDTVEALELDEKKVREKEEKKKIAEEKKAIEVKKLQAEIKMHEDKLKHLEEEYENELKALADKKEEYTKKKYGDDYYGAFWDYLFS